MGRILIALVLGSAFAAPALAAPAMTTAPTDMRESPNPKSRIVQSIPARAVIDVDGCGKIWCSASWRDISGYVRMNVVSEGAPVGPPPVYPDGPQPVFVAPPPVVLAPFGGCCFYGYGHAWRHYY
jgi:uncharacterized protein YraI